MLKQLNLPTIGSWLIMLAAGAVLSHEWLAGWGDRTHDWVTSVALLVGMLLAYGLKRPTKDRQGVPDNA